MWPVYLDSVKGFRIVAWEVIIIVLSIFIFQNDVRQTELLNFLFAKDASLQAVRITLDFWSKRHLLFRFFSQRNFREKLPRKLLLQAVLVSIWVVDVVVRNLKNALRAFIHESDFVSFQVSIFKEAYDPFVNLVEQVVVLSHLDP